MALSGQNKALKRDSLQAELYYKKALEWKEKEVLDSTILWAKKSAQIYAELQMWKKWYGSQGMVCISLSRMREFHKAIDYLQFNSDNILPQVDDPIYHANIRNWFGYIYSRMEEFDKAMKYYLDEMKILEDAGNPGGREGNYAGLGVIFTMQGDYSQAISYLERAERVYLKKQDTKNLRRVYVNLGLAYTSNKEYGKGIEAYLNSLKYGKDESQVFFLLGGVYSEKGNLDTAMHFANQAFKSFTQKDSALWEVESLIANIYKLKGDYENAELHYQKASKHYEDTDGERRRETGKFYFNAGEVYFKTDRFPLALTHYQKALQEFLPNFKNTDPKVNPDLEVMDPAYGLWIMEALDAKGRIFQRQFATKGDPQQLELALDCYESAFKTIDFLRYHQKEADSKIDLINYAHPIYEHAIDATMILYERSKDEKYLNQAFAFSQRTKAFLLGAALQNINARKEGGVPDSLIQREETLKASVLRLKQKILAAKNEEESVDEIALEQLNTEHFETKRSLDKLLDQLGQDYPEYYQLKYENKVASIADIRSNVLKENTAMIDYFMGDSSLFVLTITKDKTDFQAIERTQELDSFLGDFIVQVGNADFATNANAAYQTFTESAHFLFQQLLEKSLEKAGTKINQLIIIPDGILNTLPFEALLMEERPQGAADYSFANLSYVLEQYTVNYHYAAQVLIAQKKNQVNRDKLKIFGGFAPDFSAGETSLIRDCVQSRVSNLRYNRKEVEAISQSLGGVPYLNELATVEAFKRDAKDYRILHLATHACMSEEDPLKHKIYFAEEKYLRAIELFNLPIQAEMVVLSACETGVGKFVKGEGVMNLARGFSYNGCPSVMMSLWSVSDKASSEIMIQFYKELDKGLSKDQALRAAKLNFVSANKSVRHHPYYWAAFVPVGDAGAIDLGTSWSSSVWWIGLVVMGLLLLFFVRKRLNE